MSSTPSTPPTPRARVWITAGLLGVALCGCSSLTGSTAGGTGGSAGGDDGGAASTSSAADVPATALDLERVCTDGLGYSGMPAYDRTKKTVHPAVLMNNPGDSWSQSEPPAGDFPKGWVLGYSDKPADAELVVCVERTKASPTGKKCDMESDDGKPFTVSTYNTSYRLKVVEARTGKELSEHTGEARSDECPMYIFTSDGEDKDKHYNEVRPKDYRKRVQPFIAP
ncbi:hypothetical protein O3Q52_39910 [Streptomyces sp. ActVer]|uniref:hypothetical protein n=1 Tax=Streptomyces sp. ActVer TaxID=3014558 RepID=UPI0022B53CEC|nr:hypothetical protein [Streptomyces sp. ActVer]MCZ4514197.1 hypothetical protein [Streptomyces sp. ActVer]